MTKRLLYIFLLFFALFCFNYTFTATTQKSIALLPIRIAGGANTAAFSVALNGALISGLKQMNRLRVVDRDNLNRVINELQFSQSDLSQARNAIRLGKLVAADYLLNVSIAHDSGVYVINASVIKTETGNIVKSIHPISLKKISEVANAAQTIVNRLLGTEEDVRQDTDYTGTWIVIKTAQFFKNHGLTYKKLVLSDEGNYEIHLINNADNLVVFHGTYSIEGHHIDFRHQKIFINGAPSYIPSGTKIMGTVYIVDGKLFFTVSNMGNRPERLDAMNETYRNIARKKL